MSINPTLTISQVETAKEYAMILEIRRLVFVQEQHVDPIIEYDEHEESSHHYMAVVNHRIVGTARWRKTWIGVKLERFAVLKSFRNQGIGSELLSTLLKHIPEKSNLYMHSNINACSLFERHGFVKEGGEFIEGGMPHYKMVLDPRRS